MAKDLREISAALKMISDLERIGDQASDIAELVPYVHLEEGTGLHIGDMARAVIRMVTDSVDSFVKRDLDLARAVYTADDKVDALFDQVKQELIGMIAKDASRSFDGGQVSRAHRRPRHQRGGVGGVLHHQRSSR